MRICYLAPATSSHISKWSYHMSLRGHDVHVISFTPGALEFAEVHELGASPSPYASDANKILYLTKAPKVRGIIREIDPDILHAHYATSYGLLASLAADRPYYLSVWGSDIYDFPNKTLIHESALRYSLTHASWLLSTSHAMAQEAAKYTSKPLTITPFGVDIRLFSPTRRIRNAADEKFVVGTVKALERKYGIDTLLRSVAEAKRLRPDIPFEVRIAGIGSMAEHLKSLSDKLGLAQMVSWLGYISQENAATEWANMDVAVVSSESESFGVSAVEAEASGVPIIYTDIPGLMEACGDGKNGICVKRCDYNAIAENLIWLYDNPQERRRLGDEERKFVAETYEINRCFDAINAIYTHEE